MNEHPDHLGAPFDWRSVPHDELYRMVHDGLNLDSGAAAAEGWTRLGVELTELGHTLTALTRRIPSGWEGDTAELVTEGLTTLAHWTHQVGDKATGMAESVSIEVNNAAQARATMPPPVELHAPDMTQHGGMGVAPAFASGGFGSAQSLLLDQNTVLGQMRTKHAEAARVVSQFQEASHEVSKTVPAFGAPKRLVRPDRVAPEGTRHLKRQGDEQAHPKDDSEATPSVTTTSAAAPEASGARSGGLSGQPSERPTEGFGRNPAPGPQVGAGATPRAGAATTSGPVAAQGRGGLGGGFGAMPMGGMMGGRGGDQERSRRSYLADDDIWACPDDVTVCPPVLGLTRDG